MHGARAGLQCDEGSQNQQAVSLNQGMDALLSFQHFALEFIDDLTGFAAVPESVQAIIQHVFGYDQDVVVDFHGGVDEIVLDGDGQVCGNRPGRGRPDHHENFLPRQFGPNGPDVRCEGKPDINGRGMMVGIFHFCLRQRRLAGGAPVHGLFPLINAAVQKQFAELMDRGGFIRIGHGQIGIFPFAENAEALELIALNADILFRIDAAGAAFFHLRQAGVFSAQLLVHLVFDRQSMAIPARDIYAVETGHVFGLDHDILDDFVQRRSQMNIAVGVGRAVMQNIGFFALGTRADLVVNVHIFPSFQHFRLAPGQIRLHGEIGLGKIQRFFVIHIVVAPVPLKKIAVKPRIISSVCVMPSYERSPIT
ncbi:MAG: hypothetical protein BWX45_00311 [Deltaproteobacteria bacterium ADurb.Bin002]|nr:MAG: hypothetical protein BWX45_00311 [Deltaproteobacteria bacterium ADurb.Bin002]